MEARKAGTFTHWKKWKHHPMDTKKPRVVKRYEGAAPIAFIKRGKKVVAVQPLMNQSVIKSKSVIGNNFITRK